MKALIPLLAATGIGLAATPAIADEMYLITAHLNQISLQSGVCIDYLSEFIENPNMSLGEDYPCLTVVDLIDALGDLYPGDYLDYVLARYCPEPSSHELCGIVEDHVETMGENVKTIIELTGQIESMGRSTL